MKSEKYLDFVGDIDYFCANNKYCFVACGMQIA